MSVPRFWREIPQRYDLVGNKCKKCKKIYFPPRNICPDCFGTEFEDFDVKNEGKIVTYTILHVAQEGFESQVPYPIAIIELVEGPRITAQIVDCKPEDVEIGKNVKAVFRRVAEDASTGVLHYSYKFRLVK